jgi:hypothetical protein
MAIYFIEKWLNSVHVVPKETGRETKLVLRNAKSLRIFKAAFLSMNDKNTTRRISSVGFK